MFKKLLQLLFPPRCINCHQEGAHICFSCKNDLMFSPHLVDIDTHLSVYVACKKNGLLRKIIHLFKYNYKEEVADILGEMLQNTIAKFNDEFNDTVFVPIPIHYLKKFSRGFNQVEILSKYLTEKTKIPTINLLYRKSNTTSQATLSKANRITNVKDVFEINSKSYNSNLLAKNIVLIDDVVTTGSTLLSARNILKNYGFKKISALTLCHGL